jgi:hypothetical protein
MSTLADKLAAAAEKGKTKVREQKRTSSEAGEREIVRLHTGVLESAAAFLRSADIDGLKQRILGAIEDHAVRTLEKGEPITHGLYRGNGDFDSDSEWLYHDELPVTEFTARVQRLSEDIEDSFSALTVLRDHPAALSDKNLAGLKRWFQMFDAHGDAGGCVGDWNEHETKLIASAQGINFKLYPTPPESRYDRNLFAKGHGSLSDKDLALMGTIVDRFTGDRGEADHHSSDLTRAIDWQIANHDEASAKSSPSPKQANNSHAKPEGSCELKIGDEVSDGTIYAGISPDTHKPIYARPEDEPGTYNCGEAEQHAKHIGNGFRVPTTKELDVLYENRDKGKLKGTFNETGSCWAGWYWSSKPDGMQRFSDGRQSLLSQYRLSTSQPHVSSLRLVR